MMSGIKGKDTKPEKVVRSLLHRMGFRFRLHAKGLPGKPDIVLPKYKTVIFVHGCFWHRHKCKLAYIPKTNTAWWTLKFEATIERDMRTVRALRRQGWKPKILWECELRRNPEALVVRLGRMLRS